MTFLIISGRKQIFSSVNKFKFFLSDYIDPIKEIDPIWGDPFPVSRTKTPSFTGESVTYGDYFKAVKTFLSENCFHINNSSIYQQSNMTISPEQIDNVLIFLEKHGEYYHPSKVEVTAEKRQWKFVLNAAFSEAGLRLAEKEFELLRRLGNEYPAGFIPHVYEYGDIDSTIAGFNFRMFLGQWFSGFNEFHIHSIDHDGNCCIEVWDQKKGNYFISEKQAYEIYRQTALIHTFYYNLKTSEQIHPWHHAAGDFVVKTNEDEVEVKLVTVRGYHSLFRNDEKDVELNLEPLLLFLMDLSIKNRIDRFRGVGDLALTNEICLMATIDGFFKGLHQKSLLNIISDTFIDYLGTYFKSFTRSSIEQLFTDIISAWPRQAPELEIVQPQIKSHAFLFEFLLNRFLTKHSNV